MELGKKQAESMPPEATIHTLVEFVRVHRDWGPPVVFALAFVESLPFLSLLFPAWGALVAIGALIHATGISFWPFWVAGSLGAALGDWLSYWVGRRFKGRIERAWPLSRDPHLVRRGHRFVKRWGVLGIFVGRFLGPLRAIVPLVAGILEMPYSKFQAVNFLSAFIWVWALLKFGDFGLTAINWLF